MAVTYVGMTPRKRREVKRINWKERVARETKRKKKKGKDIFFKY